MNIPEEAVKKLYEAEHVAVLTGAGISAESGIATFRDPDGLWAKFNPIELASMDGFMSNPGLVWSWYQHRRKVIYSNKPNPGHYAIAEMQELFPKFTLITQNVDRLHHRAGSRDVYELHGNIIENYCVDCKTPCEEEINTDEEEAPLCKSCGGKIRPNVVWFGEMLPFEALRSSEEAAIACDVFFSVGTSAEVYPAANLPVIAKNHGAYVIEVNPNATAISPYMDTCLSAPSGEALPELLTKLKEYRELHG